MNIDALPWDRLPPSVRVDVLQFVATPKAAMRFRTVTPRTDLRAEIGAWAEHQGLGADSDDAYTCVAVDPATAGRVLRLDASPEPHAYELGIALGYPDCCSAAIAAAGEDRIDSLVAAAHTWRYSPPFQIIDPTSYLTGRAFISHVPCSPHCDPSLRLANRARDWLATALATAPAGTEPWTTWSLLSNGAPT